MIKEVTELNPAPIKLKLEKVYLPCALETKKRYVGYSYETPDQKKPTLDAKGIETIRRDGCPLVARVSSIMHSVLFTFIDISMTLYIDNIHIR